jgi:hypothetical protein
VAPASFASECSALITPAPQGGWDYHVYCARTGRHLRAWKPTRDEALIEVAFLRAHFGCAGHGGADIVVRDAMAQSAPPPP